MSNTVKIPRVNKTMRLRREVSFTLLRVFQLTVGDNSTAAATMCPAIKYALGAVANRVKVIDWVALAGMQPHELDIPDWLPCGSRYATNVSLDLSTADALESFRSAIATEFVQLQARGVYSNFAIAVLFRAVIADELGKLPYKVADDAELSEDAPAAFNPSELLSADASRAADPARKKHMTFARIDPSIFDQSDLFPNGKVDAEGYADASELF
jgi:hypothetical protein